MSNHDSFERLKLANPAPTRIVDDKPSAFEMLATAQDRQARRRAPEPRKRREWSSGPVVAAVAFAVVVLVALPILLFAGGSEELTPATSTPVATSAPVIETTPKPEATTPPGPSPQELVDSFVAAYNSGDVDAVANLLHPEFRREITRELALEPQPLETVRTLLEVDAALNTEIALECSPGTSALICELTRFDDLHRILDIAPTADRRWLLTFEDGLLVSWAESRQNFAVEYETSAIRPFLDWLKENRPGVVTPYPFVDGDWVTREGIADEMATLVAEWAADLGVDLGG